MKTSESIAKIAPALLKAQQAITFASKDATNPHFRSKYADLPAVIDACKPALNNAGIAFLQTNSPSEHGHIAITTRLLHESGEWIEDTATCPLPKNDPQGYGSAQTYLRRYSLASAVGLYQDDDDGQAASKPKTDLKAVEAAKSVGKANFDALPPDRQKALADLHTEVMDELDTKTANHAYDMYRGIVDALPSVEEQTAFRSMFNSQVRTQFTKIYNQRKEAA